MNDSTALLAGNSKKYNIPLSHFEHKYIQNCTDAKELERIYAELTSGDVGSYPDLEKLTLDRIEIIKPNSKVLRQDKPPLDRSSLPDEELREFNSFLQQVKANNNKIDDHSNNNFQSVPPIRTTAPAVIKAVKAEKKIKSKRILPRSYDEWGKLEKSINSDDETNIDEEKTKTKKTNETIKPVEPTKTNQQLAEEHRISGNNAFKENNYQQAIDAYSNSIRFDDSNTVVYMNRALAYYRINNYESSLNDCSYILGKEPTHIKALFRRASCYIAQQQYEQARLDLNHLIRIEPGNADANKLLTTIPEVQKPKGIRIPITEDDGDDGDDVDEDENNNNIASTVQPVKIPILEVDDEDEDNKEESCLSTEQIVQEDDSNQSTSISVNIDIPTRTTNTHARPCIDSQEASPANYDSYMNVDDDRTSFNRNVLDHLSGLGDQIDCDPVDIDDDDGIPLGDEASSYPTVMSDDDLQNNRRFNVSPHEIDDDAPELIEDTNMEVTTPIEDTYQPPVFRVNNIYNQQTDNDRSPYERSTETEVSNCNSSSSKSNGTNDYQHKQINESSFGPMIQSWLHDKVNLESSQRSNSSREKPWSKSSEPRFMNKLRRDIDRFYTAGDYLNTIEASKKLLKNGALDYHNHAEYIGNILVRCAQCNVKIGRLVLAVQYATEALQYNKFDTIALMCRAKAFEDQENYFYSYADYSRIPSNDFSYEVAQKNCAKLSIELKTKYGENWKDNLTNETDDEKCLKFLKEKDPATSNVYEWFRQRANQLYLDACYTLSIRCYTNCIEMQPTVTLAYLNRAACYLKMFEGEKTIEDCERFLTSNVDNPRALYRKACALKMCGDHRAYVSTLENLIKVQPNNQIVLAEYYNCRRENVPRRMRRLRENPPEVKEEKPAKIVVQEKSFGLTFDELEAIRTRKMPVFSPNVPFQFIRQFESLKPTDLNGLCSIFLRLPNQSLMKFVRSATSKLVESIILVTRTMINAERKFQQQNKNIVVPFSYVQFSFELLLEMTCLARLDTVLSMIDNEHRVALDEILDYFNSISTMFKQIEKLDRLRQKS